MVLKANCAGEPPRSSLTPFRSSFKTVNRMMAVFNDRYHLSIVPLLDETVLLRFRFRLQPRNLVSAVNGADSNCGP